MKNQNVVVALIIAVALLISAGIISSGFKTFAGSMERAASSIGNGLAAQDYTNIPSSSKLDLGEVRIGNAGRDDSPAFHVEVFTH